MRHSYVYSTLNSESIKPTPPGPKYRIGLPRWNQLRKNSSEPEIGLAWTLRKSCPVSSPSLPGDGCIRVMLVDDHALVRMSVSLILGAAAGIEVVGECADG